MPVNPTERFSNRVQNYIKYRPNYPSGCIDVLRENIDLESSWLIADIGSGTGISSELFLKNRNTVYGIEPNAEMRIAAEALLCRKYPDFISLDGTAEETGLEAASVDLVVGAQALHWFKRDQALIEFKRILKPGGYLVFLWNERRNAGTPFLEEYEKFLRSFAGDYEKVTQKNLKDRDYRKFYGKPGFQTAGLDNCQIFDFEALQGRLLSSSYAPMEGRKYEIMISELKKLFDKHQENGFIRIDYDTKIYWGRING